MSSRHRIEVAVWGTLRRVVIAFAVVATLFPLLYALFLSVRPLSEVISNPLSVFPTDGGVQLDTYSRVLRSEDDGGYGLGQFMLNSFVLAGSATVLTIASSTLGAYAAVRLQFRGRDTINAFFFAIYVFPSIVLAVPLFVMFSQLKLGSSVWGLIIVYMAQTLPVCLYMLRNYFQAVPPSIEEAAMIDGCGRLKVIRYVVLPVALPGIAATSLYVFMIAWNEYLFALLFLVQDRERWTVSLGLDQLTEGGAVPITILMAGAVSLTLPVVVLFFLAERLLISGLTAVAEKG
jgi:multiple sugar transport system permease protein